jgi:hypothetical protein
VAERITHRRLASAAERRQLAFQLRPRGQRVPCCSRDVVEAEMLRRPVPTLVSKLRCIGTRRGPRPLFHEIDRRRRAKHFNHSSFEQSTSDPKPDTSLVERDRRLDIIDIDVDQKVHRGNLSPAAQPARAGEARFRGSGASTGWASRSPFVPSLAVLGETVGQLDPPDLAARARVIFRR